MLKISSYIQRARSLKRSHGLLTGFTPVEYVSTKHIETRSNKYFFFCLYTKNKAFYEPPHPLPLLVYAQRSDLGLASNCVFLLLMM